MVCYHRQGQSGVTMHRRHVHCPVKLRDAGINAFYSRFCQCNLLREGRRDAINGLSYRTSLGQVSAAQEPERTHRRERHQQEYDNDERRLKC